MGSDKIALLLGLGLITIWDAFTTITGTADMLGSNGVAFFLSSVFGLGQFFKFCSVFLEHLNVKKLFVIIVL